MAPLNPSDVGVDVGQVLEGKYRVDAILGQGGMGTVVACTHMGLGERYALKLLRRDVLADEDAVQRFNREARAAVRLKSEYVARVFDVGAFANGVPFMVMEFLEGLDIGSLLEERGTLPIPWASELALQAAEALCEAHSLGIVHRDVKPTNLFVTWRPDGSALVKVLDFGISKSPVGTEMKLTQTQSVLGTPAYMSPEQMRSAHMVDSRSDIWSLGTVLYEMIEGHRPFEADSFSEMCVKVAVDPPLPMHNAPPVLQAIVARCLAKAPDQRYATMAELGRDLVQFAPNAQQAQHLVERMTRMMHRSQLGWDGEMTSSNPNLRGVRAASPALGIASAALDVPHRRRWPWAIGVFAFGALAAAIALASAGGPDGPAPLPSVFLERAIVAPPIRVATPTPAPVAPAPVPVAPVAPVMPVAQAKPTRPIRHATTAAPGKRATDATIAPRPGPPAPGTAGSGCDPFRPQHPGETGGCPP